MSLFTRIEAIEPALAKVEADVAAFQNASSGVTADQLAALQAQVDGIRADVGTPAVPTA